jgi:phosphatidylserine decarboxylase
MVRDGYFYGLAMAAVAALAVWLTGHAWWAAPPLALGAFFLWFFRDPDRAIPQAPGLVVSPADGKVTEIALIETPAGPRQRISIFLSVFNVHVNRAPIAGRVLAVAYHKGEFLNAMNPLSAERNEQSVDTLGGGGTEVTFKLIAGLLARRIVFRPRVGDTLERGQRVGLIKFGSRVDVLLPAGARVAVRRGETVRGGASVLASLGAEG